MIAAMTEFSEALAHTITALEGLRQVSDRPPRASRLALQRLLETPFRSDEPAQENVTARIVPAPLPDEIAAGDKAARLEQMSRRVAGCVLCPHLAATRTQTVFGVGNPDAELMFIGEAPGADEDRVGEPFVGRAGQLLTKIIAAMGLSRDEVYIANVLKCRPNMPAGAPGNRKPTPEEMATCLPYLSEQIEIIGPKVLVALGATAVEGLIGVREPMNRLRGRWHECGARPLMITFHPSYLLRNQTNAEKRKVWEDMLLVLERLEHPISEKQRNFFR